MNHFLHSVYEENLFQMPALPFRAKSGRSSAGIGVVLVKMPVHGRLRAVQRGQRQVACWPLTLPSLPFCPSACFILPEMLWGSGTVRATGKALWCWKVSYKCSDLTTGIFASKMKLLLQSRFTDSSSRCKFCHLFQLWISKHTDMER